MRHLVTRVLGLAIVLAACGVDEVDLATRTACPATGVIEDPPQFQWTFHPAGPGNPTPYFSGILEYGEATFTIGTSTLTTRAYRQAGGTFTIPGPTIKMTPGNKYVLRYRNLLPFAPASTEHNVFKDPNISNLHTHGLHVSGESPSDDVTRFFEGTRGGDFVYDIPPEHMGGTYWYHAHHHGATFLQVSSGAFGQLIIDDGNDGIPANVAAMTERQLVVAFLDPSVAGTGGDTLISGTLSPTWTVNGRVQGGLCTTVNEWQHWRVLLADRQATEKTFGVGASCEIMLLARDGVWRTTAPLAMPTRSISLTGASRADFAVRCTDDSVITINGATVANIFAFGDGNTTVGPFSNGSTGGTWSATRPAYLRDLRGAASPHLETIHMGARTINGSKFEEDVPNLTLNANQVQNWTLAGNNQHPFHLHVYHVQAQNCGGSFENGEYYDVVTDPCDVRFDLNAATSRVYEGRTIMHCHILEHEDQGAMGWTDVVGGLPPPAFPNDTTIIGPYAESYAQGSAAWCTDNAACSNGNACDGVEICDPATSTCVAGMPPSCDDGSSCTTDSCSPATGCTHAPVPNGQGCGDGNVCNGTETCQNGACVASAPPTCNDGNACTIDSCNATTGCATTPAPNGQPCGDGNACNGNETCQGGACAGGTPLACNDGNVCTNDACDPATGCTATPVSNGQSCGDGNACNGNETCQGGACAAGTPLSCDDGNPCTIDACDSVAGCTHTATSCDGPATCSYDGVSGTITVTMLNQSATLAVSSGNITLGATTCGTVTNTDTIVVNGTGYLTVRGDFMPGRTAEPTGISEIEFVINNDKINFDAYTGDDVIRVVNSGADLDNDGDLDVTMSGTQTTVQYNGGSGNDTIDASACTGKIYLYGGAGNDHLIGGSGGDYLYGQGDNDVLDGNNGNDLLYGGLGVDVVRGGNGNDSIYEETTANGGDTLDGGANTDTLSYATRTIGVNVTLSDGLANDGEAGEGDTTIAIENVTGGLGNDTLVGDDLNNVLKGGEGSDTLRGGNGIDTLYGGNGNDALFGDAGNDTFNEEAAANGADTFDGGAGIDVLSYASRTHPIDVSLNDGVANDGEAGEGDTSVLVENVTGGSAGDTIVGDDLANVVRGGGGNDTLRGRGGADTLYGDAGNDFLDGELGADRMYGGDNNDTLVGDAASTETFYGEAGDDTIIGNADGRIETVNCGSGNDTAHAGEDTFTACETLTP